MTSNSRKAALLLIVAFLLAALQASAQSASEPIPPESKAQARVHFDRGIALTSAGQLEAAVAEFESAYRLSPHYSVLFNIGQTHAAMGRSVDAAETFRRYLDEGGVALDAGRHKLVSELISFHEKRIGLLRLDVQPDGAEVSLDGRVIGTSPLREPVKVVAGTHGVAVRKEGYSQTATSFEAIPGDVTELVLRAEVAASRNPRGLLVVRCAVPDVDILVDGRASGRTPDTQSINVHAGRRTIRFARRGYVPDQRMINVSTDRPVSVGCRLEKRLTGPNGSLRVLTRPAGAVVLLDGEPFRGGPLPIGRHSMRIERAGYQPWTRFVTVEQARTALVTADLKPTHEQAEAWRGDSRRRHAWALALTIGGGVLAGAGAFTYVWNSTRYADWKRDRREVDSALSKGPVTSELLDRNASLERRATSIRGTDDAAVVLGVAGGITLGASTFLWLDVLGGPEQGTPSPSQK
jgi:hypothetical protein